MSVSTHSVQVAIVGAGPAGIAVSSRLARRAVAHVVLEREHIGWSWEAQRWGSFRLNTPQWANVSLGTARSGARDTFASASAVVGSLKQLARGLPVVEGAEVFGARRVGRAWRLETARGTIAAESVVVASGFQNVPRLPAYAGRLPEQIRQLHAADYRSPVSLGDRILVVGGGQSGVQIAEDLVDAGKHVLLATSRVGRLPRRYVGRDALTWLRETGQLDLARDQADPAAIGATPAQITGAGGGHTLSYQSLAARGVTLLGRAVDWTGGQLQLSEDLGDNVRFADQVSSFYRAAWKKRARLFRGGRDISGERDPADEPATHLYDAPGPPSLDLVAAKISTVIWATGFGPSIGWLPEEALDARQHPRLPGLHVIGAPWLTHRSSANLYGIARDADEVANALTSRPVSIAA